MFEKTKINEKEARVGPFKKNILTFVVTNCGRIYNLVIEYKHRELSYQLKLQFKCLATLNVPKLKPNESIFN